MKCFVEGWCNAPWRPVEFYLWAKFSLVLMLCLIAVSCSQSPQQDAAAHVDSGDTDPATQRMVRLLDKIANQGDFQTDGYLNLAYVKYLEKVAPKSNPAGRAEQLFKLSRQYLFAGRTDDALKKLAEIKVLLAENEGIYSEKTETNFLSLMALANLRQGEQDNCLDGHSPEMCIFPISGGGIHQKRQGSEAAILIYEDILRRDPDNLNARWLLNIAYMTLGEYPEKVPAKWFVDSSLWESDTSFPRFKEIAISTQSAITGLAGSVVIEDFNGDGFLDLLTSTWGLQEDVVYLEHNGKDGFVDKTMAAGLTGIKGGLNMIQADVDNDGHRDVLILRGGWRNLGGHHPNSLLRNLGGRFVDITEAWGVLSFSPTQTATFADFDRDGKIDLFVGNESTPGNIHPCKLYRNLGERFEDITAESKLQIVGYVKSVVSGDVDNDGLPDIFVSRLNGPNILLHNDGPREDGAGMVFSDITDTAGVAEPKQSFPGWFFDYDNDGWLDLFVSGYGREFQKTAAGAVLADYLGRPNSAELPKLYRNLGNGRFEDVTRTTGLNHVFLTMGCGYGDLDNDGWLDFYLGTGAPDFQALVPNLMWRNQAGKRFQNVTTAGGFGHLQKGHGIAFADLDNDGDQDVYAVMGGAYTGDVFPNALFENPGFGNHWVTLIFEGRQSSRDALGTRFSLKVSPGGNSREIHGIVSSGGSFGATSLQRTMGLGSAVRVDSLAVEWPVSGRQIYRLPSIDGVYRIVEGAAEPEAVMRSAMVFARDSTGSHNH